MHHRATRLIWGNIIVDAFGTATFLAGVGFFAISAVGVDAAHLLSALATGGLVGVALSFPVSSWVDVWGARRILLVVQALQVVLYVVMAVADVPSVVLASCAMGAALSRVTSPVRGALPPLYLKKSELVEFKARVRVWTIGMALVGSAVAALLGMAGNDGLTVLIPLANAMSFLVTLALTLALPKPLIAVDAKRRWWQIYRPSPPIILSAALFGLLFCLAYVPDSAVSVVVADLGLPSWVVAVSPALALAVALGGERVVRSRGEAVRRLARPILLWALAVEVVSLTLLSIAVHEPDLGTPLVIFLLVLGASGAEVALIGLMFVLWDMQYNIGRDADRGGIVGVFGIGTSAGMAASPATASALLFHGSVAAVVVALAMVLVALSGILVATRHATAESSNPGDTLSAAPK